MSNTWLVCLKAVLVLWSLKWSGMDWGNGCSMMHFHNKPIKGQKPDSISDILWFGFLPVLLFFSLLQPGHTCLSSSEQAVAWFTTMFHMSAGQALCVWTVGADEESCGLSPTLCMSSSVADGMFTSWWQRSHGTWGSLWVWVCPVLPLSAFGCFSWPSYYWFPSPSPTPVPSILFSFPQIHFLFVVLLTLPVHTLCVSCFLSPLMETFQSFLHLKSPQSLL